MDIAIVTSVRNENDYLPDWLDWHFKLGFTRIILYDHNIEQHTMDHLCSTYPNLQIIPLNPKCTTFRQRICKNAFDLATDWFIVLDIDEYLNISVPVPELLSNYSDCKQLSVKRLELGDDGKITDDYSQPVYNRFKQYVKSFNMTYKSFFNKRLIDSFSSFYGYCLKESGKRYIINYRKEQSNSIFHNSTNPEPNEPFIKHFRTKSLAEYCKYKLKTYWYENQLRHKLPTIYYFRINQKTQDKLNYIKQFNQQNGISRILYIVPAYIPWLSDQYQYILGNPDNKYGKVINGSVISGTQILNYILDDFDSVIFVF